MNLFNHYFRTFSENAGQIAFVTEEQQLTYLEFMRMISGIRELLENQVEFQNNSPIGIICRNNIETYAAIFACWFSGRAFVPLHPSHPVGWNSEIETKTGIDIAFDSVDSIEYQVNSEKMICIAGLKSDYHKFPADMESGATVYILTTSGSTGKPKYVPISLLNIHAFVNGFLKCFPLMDKNDKFLQTYDLTSDAAFTAYLIPLYLGAAVYTLPGKTFRYLEVAKMLASHAITWVQVTPSLLSYLRPYFHKLKFSWVKYFHFGGENLPSQLVSDWWPSVPNAEIANVYGPTETTITSTIYKCRNPQNFKSHHGSVSIGKPLPEVDVLLVDTNGVIVDNEGEGELMIAGTQVMQGYIAEGNQQTFVTFILNGTERKFYPTGDAVFRDTSGFLYFIERMNDQVKIRGYRVDLVQIEANVSKLCNYKRTAAIAPEINVGFRILVVYIEQFTENEKVMLNKLRADCPPYMVPDKIVGIDEIPLNLAGKTDKKLLAMNFFREHNDK